MTAKNISTWLSFALYVGATAGYFAGSPVLSTLVSLMLAFYLALEFRRMAVGPRVAGGVLVGLGLAVALYAGDPVGPLLAGLHRTQSFFLLFAAVTWLHYPAGRSPSLQAAQETAMRQPPGRRYAALMTAAHILGSVLNMAGISLLSGIISNQPDPGLKRRLTCAIARGFTSASCWTPFYIAVTVVLSILPGLKWSDLAPSGLFFAICLIGLGWTMDRISRRRRCPGPDQTATRSPPATATATWDWRAVAVPASLFSAVVILVEGLGLPIPIALGVLAPPYAVVWIVAQTYRRIDAISAVGDLARRVGDAIPNLRNEIFIFAGANILGAGMAAAVPPESVEAVVGMLGLSFAANLALVLAVILALAMAGLHPVIVFVLIGEVLPPEILGISPVAFGAALLAMWGIGAVVSPFSGTSLYLARAAGISPWRVSWGWNGVYAIAATTTVGVIIVVARGLGIH